MKYFNLIFIIAALYSCTSTITEKNTAGLTEDEILSTIEKSIIDSLISNNYRPSVMLMEDEKVIWMDSNMPMSDRFLIPISTKKFIKGDLTGDGIDDIIVPGSDEAGASAYVPTLYLFKAIEKNKYSSTYLKFTGFDLAYCKNQSEASGRFYAKSIKSNTLIGESVCYSKQDANCCPSLKFETKLKFDNQKDTFQFVSQKPIK